MTIDMDKSIITKYFLLTTIFNYSISWDIQERIRRRKSLSSLSQIKNLPQFLTILVSYCYFVVYLMIWINLLLLENESGFALSILCLTLFVWLYLICFLCVYSIRLEKNSTGSQMKRSHDWRNKNFGKEWNPRSCFTSTEKKDNIEFFNQNFLHINQLFYEITNNNFFFEI